MLLGLRLDPARVPPAALIVGPAAAVVAVLAVHSGGGVGHADAHGALEAAVAMAAMMSPLSVRSAAVAAERSLRRRRPAAVVEHAAGFAAVWLVFALGAVALTRWTPAAFPVALAVAAWWQLSPRRRTIVERCGRLRVSPLAGWRADVGVLRSGVDAGGGCVRTCWASMLAMAAAPSLTLIALVWAVSLSEWAPGPRQFDAARRLRPALVYAALAAWHALVTLR